MNLYPEKDHLVGNFYMNVIYFLEAKSCMSHVQVKWKDNYEMHYNSEKEIAFRYVLQESYISLRMVHYRIWRYFERVTELSKSDHLEN